MGIPSKSRRGSPREAPRSALASVSLHPPRKGRGGIKRLRRRRSHRKVEQLFNQRSLGHRSLYISVVNLAEALQHAERYSSETGVDVVALLGAFKIGIHSPDVEIARRASLLAALPDASLADRFAAATANALRARLYTTDSVLPLLEHHAQRGLPEHILQRAEVQVPGLVEPSVPIEDTK